MEYNEQVEVARTRFVAAIPRHPEILTTKDVCDLPDEVSAIVHGLGLSGQQAQFALDAAQAASTPSKFEKQLEDLINRHSRENGSDTPDFILAAYLERCLLNFNETVTRRTAWYAPLETGTGS